MIRRSATTPAASGEPGALVHGGCLKGGSFAGPLAVNGPGAPTFLDRSIGFRCAR
jgi:hypothetical protein